MVDENAGDGQLSCHLQPMRSVRGTEKWTISAIALEDPASEKHPDLSTDV